MAFRARKVYRGFRETGPRGVWVAHEILSGVFDISYQSKQKLRSERRKNKSSKSLLIDRDSKPPRVQNSRIFCERERRRRSIFERSGASVKTARENGERR